MLSLEDDTQSKPAESQPSAGHQQQTQQGDDSTFWQKHMLFGFNKNIENRILQATWLLTMLHVILLLVTIGRFIST